MKAITEGQARLAEVINPLIYFKHELQQPAGQKAGVWVTVHIDGVPIGEFEEFVETLSDLLGMEITCQLLDVHDVPLGQKYALLHNSVLSIAIHSTLYRKEGDDGAPGDQEA